MKLTSVLTCAVAAFALLAFAFVSNGNASIVPLTSVDTHYSNKGSNSYGGNAGAVLKPANRTDVSPFDASNDRALRGFAFFQPTAQQKQRVLDGDMLLLTADLQSITDGPGNLENLDIRFKGRGNLIASDAWGWAAEQTFSSVLTPAASPGTYTFNVSGIADAGASVVNRTYWLFSFVTPSGFHNNGSMPPDAFTPIEMYQFDPSSVSLTVIPEPSTLLLWSLGLLGLGWYRGRRRR